MRTDDLDYDLDPDLVAREPAEPRDSARLLVYQRASGRIEHRRVRDLAEYLRPGDLLVVNETQVAPARIKAVRLRDGAGGAEVGAHIEGLLLERRGPREWMALLKHAKRVKPGEGLALVGPGNGTSDQTSPYRLVVHDRLGEGYRVTLEGGASAEAVLDAVGWTPLPPYILKARRDHGEGDDGQHDRADRAHYQTVFAHSTDLPSVAAPTAGLHFTPDLLAAIAAKGVERVAVELQVGAGTFKPVETATLDEHPMHSERCVVHAATLARLRAARERAARGGGRVIAVGTTSVRTLESLPSPLPAADPLGAALVWDTRLLIQPGHRFAHVDGLLTNFHLPRSTLLALVAAFVGLEKLRELYAAALRERYRFYSYGDAMLVV